jgi:SAM-dependent methyltransferase
VSGIELIEAVSPRDAMLHDDSEERRAYYFWVGEDAIRVIRLALHGAQRRPRGMKEILDLPCGHGRVMRWLRATFPEASLTACDLDADGVGFCAETFGARPVLSSADPEDLALGTFDLIWCGSLLTHLRPGDWDRWLSLFFRSLNPGGVLVFTTLGRRAIEMMVDGSYDHGMTVEQIEGLRGGALSLGQGFAAYPHHPDYGIAVARPGHTVGKLGSFRLVNYTEGGWAQHQDVVAVTRPA